jgi:hypothetical protein
MASREREASSFTLAFGAALRPIVCGFSTSEKTKYLTIGISLEF